MNANSGRTGRPGPTEASRRRESAFPREFTGYGASGGIAIGPAFVYLRSARPAGTRGPGPDKPSGVASARAPEREVERLRAAAEKARLRTEALRDKVAVTAGPEQAAIFEAQLLMLADPELLGRAEEAIRRDLLSAEAALERTGREWAAVLREIPDEYLRARAADVEDVTLRLRSVLEGREGPSLADLPGPVVIVSDELMPSDTAAMDPAKVLGVVTERGGVTSHAAILARTMGIPAVVGAAGILEAVRPEDTVAADGTAGTVLVNPDPASRRAWEDRQAAWRRRRENLDRLAVLPAVTTDGHRVRLEANVGSPADVAPALAAGAEGVGLFRTEFLFIGRDAPPSEDEQFEAYREVLRAMDGRPVTIRTLDAGGDKPLPFLEGASPGAGPEANPFLGVRGIRLCLEWEEVFLTQLRAILRAAASVPPGSGEVRVMFPMVSDLGEVRAAKGLLERAGRELEERGTPRGSVRVGIMVEVPSAAVMADRFMEEVDFVSLGTNDLTQYVMAADRMNSGVAHLADGLHPAVVRLIAAVARAGRKAGRPVAVCGDLAGDPGAAPVLVGLGLEELSMAPLLIPEVKDGIRAVSGAGAGRLARRLLRCRTAREIRERISRWRSRRPG